MSKKKFQKTVEDAGDNARDFIDEGSATLGDIADDVKSYLGIRVKKAEKAAKPIVKDARKKAEPIVKDVRKKAEPIVNDAVDRVSPAFNAAAERVTPYYEKTRDAVADGYENTVRPKLQDALDKAADNEYVAEAARRGSAAVDSLKGNLPGPVADLLPETRKEKKKHRLIKGLGIAAVLGGAAFLAIRQLLLPKDDGWTPHEPSTAYTDDDVTTDFGAPATPFSAENDSAEAEAEAAAAEPAEGSYEGENPPEGFTIKGNRRSMKYHTPDSAGYDRTIADVWFTSNEAAEAAGFTKASR